MTFWFVISVAEGQGTGNLYEKIFPFLKKRKEREIERECVCNCACVHVHKALTGLIQAGLLSLLSKHSLDLQPLTPQRHSVLVIVAQRQAGRGLTVVVALPAWSNSCRRSLSTLCFFNIRTLPAMEEENLHYCCMACDHIFHARILSPSCFHGVGALLLVWRRPEQ